MVKKIVSMEVVGGLCRVSFTPFMSTGPDGSDTSPGVGFDLVGDYPIVQDGKSHHWGIIGRNDARRLRDMLEIFLKNYAAGIDD